MGGAHHFVETAKLISAVASFGSIITQAFLVLSRLQTLIEEYVFYPRPQYAHHPLIVIFVISSYQSRLLLAAVASISCSRVCLSVKHGAIRWFIPIQNVPERRRSVNKAYMQGCCMLLPSRTMPYSSWFFGGLFAASIRASLSLCWNRTRNLVLELLPSSYEDLQVAIDKLFGGAVLNLLLHILRTD